MASGSVDETVLIWDLREGKPARTIKDHTDKVQALQWHPMEPQVLLTGCCDGWVYSSNNMTTIISKQFRRSIFRKSFA